MIIVGTFPDPKSITGNTLDTLLVPIKFLPLSKLQATLKEFERDGIRMNSPGMVEKLLLAINAGNSTNDHWVSSLIS